MTASSSSAHRLKALFQAGQLHHLGVQMVGAAGVLLLSSVILLGMNVTELQRSFAWVQDSDSELIDISGVEKHLISTELTVRGYALTGDPTFLRYNAFARRGLRATLGRLDRSLADDPPAMKRQLARVRVLVERRLRAFSRLLALGPAHADTVAVVIRDSGYRDLMRQTRAAIYALRDAELRELAGRQAVAARRVDQSYRTAVGMIVLAFAAGIPGLAFMRFGRAPG